MTGPENEGPDHRRALAVAEDAQRQTSAIAAAQASAPAGCTAI